MNKRLVFALVSVAVVLMGVAYTYSSSNGAVSNAVDNSAKWEFLATTHDGNKVGGQPKYSSQILQLGREGWELVDVETINEDGTTKKIVYFFKRKR